MSPPRIQVFLKLCDFNGIYKELYQTVPVETINFRKGTKTFKYLNKNKRWAKGEIHLGADQVHYLERKRR